MRANLLPLRRSAAVPPSILAELDPRFEILEKTAGYQSVPAFLANERHLDRTVMLQVFRIEEDADSLQTALALGEIKLPWSTFIYDVVRLESDHVILVSEPVQAPILGEWMKFATEDEVASIREQLDEWVSEWDGTWIQGARLDGNSIRIMTTAAGRPLCKIVSAGRVQDRRATVDSLEAIFHHARKVAHHARSRKSKQAWFDSLFGGGSPTPDSVATDSQFPVPARKRSGLAPILTFTAACATLAFVLGSALFAYLG